MDKNQSKHSKLADHKFQKGKFVTPFNQIEILKWLSNENSWSYGRFPEYIWIGLILHAYEKNIGINKMMCIIGELHKLDSTIVDPKLSLILKMSDEKQYKFYEIIKSITFHNILSPLTILFRYTQFSAFSKSFYEISQSIDMREKVLKEAIKIFMAPQTNETTDIRYIIVLSRIMSGKLMMPKTGLDMIKAYSNHSHEDECMRTIRPTVRSTEMMDIDGNVNMNYLNFFWNNVSIITDCEMFFLDIPKEEEKMSIYTEYIKDVKDVFQYFTDVYVDIVPLDKKMQVILGIATFSYKRLKEVIDHDLFNTITGRSCIRNMIECYIMIKYLLSIENEHKNVWEEYEYYGMGQYKLIVERFRDKKEKLEKSHVEYAYLEALVNEYQTEESINMDTKYFDKTNIRTKAEKINEKDLYGLYYDYDSAFEHGLWGAIRESALLKCNNPAHQYHCIPDIEDKQHLKSIGEDCVMIINKTISLLKSLYEMPDSLYEAVMQYEK